MTTERRMHLRIVILVPLAVVFTILVIGGAELISTTTTTRVGLHALFAYWISIPTALGFLTLRKHVTLSHSLLNTTFVTAILIHIGSAMKNLFYLNEQVIVRVALDDAIDIFEMTLFSILLASSVIVKHFGGSFDEFSPNIFYRFVMIVSAIGLYGYAALIFLPTLSPSYLSVFNIVFGLISILFFIVAAILFRKTNFRTLEIDWGYLSSALIILALSVITLLLGFSDVAWIYCENLQIAAFLLFGFALSIPFLKNVGFRRRTSYIISIGFVAIAYIPLVITTTLESMNLVNELPPNNLAFSIIHIGAVSLSAMMTYLLYEYSKKRKLWSSFPLVLIFLVWTLVEISAIFIILFPFLSPSGTPIVSYIVGSLLTLILIVMVLKWTISPTSWTLSKKSHIVLGFGFMLIAVCLFLGEFINALFLMQNPEFISSPLSNVLLLGSNLTVMLVFTYLAFLLTKKASGNFSIELYTLSFLSVWILHSILKSYYAVWTPGWWVSEYILFIGLLVGPTILALLYIGAMGEIEESHQRAGLYADLLMHDVTNYNQIAMTSLELLKADCQDEEKLLEYVGQAIQAVLLSDRLISNVRSLSETEQINHSDLKSVELVSSIVEALDLVSQSIGKERVRTQFITDYSRVHVKANELLVTAFFNILYSSVYHSEAGESVLLDIAPSLEDGQQWWNVRLLVQGSYMNTKDGSFLERRPGGFSGGSLGLFVARLLFESFGGCITIDQESQENLIIRTVITVRLIGVYPVSTS